MKVRRELTYLVRWSTHPTGRKKKGRWLVILHSRDVAKKKQKRSKAKRHDTAAIIRRVDNRAAHAILTPWIGVGWRRELSKPCFEPAPLPTEPCTCGVPVGAPPASATPSLFYSSGRRVRSLLSWSCRADCGDTVRHTVRPSNRRRDASSRRRRGTCRAGLPAAARRHVPPPALSLACGDITLLPWFVLSVQVFFVGDFRNILYCCLCCVNLSRIGATVILPLNGTPRLMCRAEPPYFFFSFHSRQGRRVNGVVGERVFENSLFLTGALGLSLCFIVGAAIESLLY